jgi:hypothetical protein
MPHLGAMCDHTGAAFTIWKPYRAEGWDPGASIEVTRQGHIGLYSGALRATFGSTVAKERRCGACRRLVSDVVAALTARPCHCCHDTIMVTVIDCETPVSAAVLHKHNSSG